MAVLNGEIAALNSTVSNTDTYSNTSNVSNSAISEAINSLLADKLFINSVISDSTSSLLFGNLLNNSTFSEILSRLNCHPVLASNYQDYLSDLARLFGVNVKQDNDYLYIQKADLPLSTVLPNNTAESLLVVLLLKAKRFVIDYLELKIEIDELQELIEREGIQIRRIELDVKFYRKLTQTFAGEWVGIDEPLTPDNI